MNLVLLSISILRISCSILAIKIQEPLSEGLEHWFKLMIGYDIIYSLMQVYNVKIHWSKDFLSSNRTSIDGIVYYNLSSNSDELSSNGSRQGINSNRIKDEIFKKHKIFALLSNILRMYPFLIM